ncbi:hypothetical protein DFQ28_006863 [Apophysomyces sp. BC1034]|nr:hypothetical protein DFQ30_006783 [Apophysomyces sp. BC1015]KAG0176722.1 hypothetical protein DFQ29_005704 [Apophysomyces sp. BC1021]KAG0187099.1 hypothetical protein DFQ28_006863 [Apophysomyces sp. BC1034]
MFFDFNIPYPKQAELSDVDRLERILTRISQMPRAVIALNQTVSNIKEAQTPDPVAPARFPTVEQLKRVTVVVEDSKKNYQLVATNPLNQTIDILAAQPTNIDVCKHACQSYDIDLISIDLSQKGVSPGYAAASVAVNRGIFFEICYTQLFRDPKRRSVFFSNVKRLVEVTRGNNLIFSSGALQALEIKRPSDLRMMGLLFGMTQEQMEAAVGYNYVRLLKKAETRKSTFNAAVRVDLLPGVEERKRKKDQPEQGKKKAKVQKTA